MFEKIQRTPEGISLIDPITDQRKIIASFPKIIFDYCRLSIDYESDWVAKGLMRRRYELEELETFENLPQAESFILENDRAVNMSDITGGLKIYRKALSEVPTLGLEEIDQRFVRMMIFDRISYLFYNYANQGGKPNLSFIQSVIASIYSDFELGAMESVSRLRHALATVTSNSSSELKNVLDLIMNIRKNKIKKLPESWWNKRIEEEFTQLLT